VRAALSLRLRLRSGPFDCAQGREEASSTRRFYGPIEIGPSRSVSFRQVKSLRQAGVILLLLVYCVAPAMACMTPDVQMTTEERACCEMMNHQCGQMDMSGSHDCCKKAPKTVFDNALKTDAAALHPVIFVSLWVSSFDIVGPRDSREDWVQRPQHSPPKPPPSTIDILRI